MATASFTFDEMVYNTVVNGKQIYHSGNLKTIDYVKLMKDTRQLQIVCQDGSVFLSGEERGEPYNFFWPIRITMTQKLSFAVHSI